MKFVKLSLLFLITISIWANCEYDSQCHYPAKCIKQNNGPIGSGRCILQDPVGNNIYKPDRKTDDNPQLPQGEVTPTAQPSPTQGIFKDMFKGSDSNDK